MRRRRGKKWWWGRGFNHPSPWFLCSKVTRLISSSESPFGLVVQVGASSKILVNLVCISCTSGSSSIPFPFYFDFSFSVIIFSCSLNLSNFVGSTRVFLSLIGTFSFPFLSIFLTNSTLDCSKRVCSRILDTHFWCALTISKSSFYCVLLIGFIDFSLACASSLFSFLLASSLTRHSL